MSIDLMPTDGIWLVKKHDYGKSSSFVMKVSDLPKKWPLLHYYEYKDQVLEELIKYVDKPRSLDDIVKFILEFISKKYVEERNSDTKDYIVEKIEDLNRDY
jgi:hypothetical protein